MRKRNSLTSKGNNVVYEWVSLLLTIGRMRKNENENEKVRKKRENERARSEC